MEQGDVILQKHGKFIGNNVRNSCGTGGNCAPKCIGGNDGCIGNR
jgi:hypothetical protein